MAGSEEPVLKSLEQRMKEKTACIWAPWEYSGPVYHYTGCSGMKGILESSSLWLTRISDFDDGREILHGMRLIDEVEHRIRYFECPTVFDEEDRWRQVLRDYFFAACFSTDGDKESQWNDHAGRGYGCAIEFDHDLLQRDAEERQGALFRMEYLHQTKKDIVERQLRFAWQIAPPGTEHRESREQCVLRKLVESACRFKQQQFRGEDEVRLFRVLEQSEIGMRLTRPFRSACILYIEWPFPRAAVKSIVLGPRGDQDKRESTLRRFLDGNGWTGLKISRSAIPVRS